MHDIDPLARSAYTYGPFFFAVLYSIFVPRWAHKMWEQAKDTDQKETYRLYFKVTGAFGLALVVAAVAWWMVPRQEIYVFQGQLRGLDEYSKLTSTDLYFRRELIEKVTPDALQSRNEWFMAVREKPFATSDIFTVYFCKADPDQDKDSSIKPKVEPLSIQYDSGPSQVYEINYSAEKKCNEIRKAARTRSVSLPNFLSSTAYAADDPVPTIPIDQIREAPSAKGDLTKDAVLVLQDEGTSVGKKIAAIDILGKARNEELNGILRFSDKEPMIATLADLCRHSDKELSSKAKDLLYTRANLKEVLSFKLSSGGQTDVESTLNLLHRLDPTVALKISEDLPVEPTQLAKIKADIAQMRNSLLLVPTGSAQGDRYYVEAAWDSHDQETVKKLTGLFNSTTMSTRSLDDESKLMRGKNKRWIYGYSKSWAADFAEKVQDAGGKASFVEGVK